MKEFTKFILFIFFNLLSLILGYEIAIFLTGFGLNNILVPIITLNTWMILVLIYGEEFE
jgi:hypothetical protein